jgi:putative transcriptional regulator
MARKNVTNEFMEAIQEMSDYLDGKPVDVRVHQVEVAPIPDIRAIRAQLGLSREQFAKRFHLPTRTVQEWEQGRRRPDQATIAYLTVIAKNPEAVEKALAAE